MSSVVMEKSPVRVSVVIPCLNEAATLEKCIQKAKTGLSSLDLLGEIIIADNGSTDGSREIAERCGARLVPVQERGYGSALTQGIREAQGTFIVMGDADDSYDFSQIYPFVEGLQEGYDLVMGCRFPRGGGKIMPGAMPWKHRWFGNPALSALSRLLFKVPVSDINCGLRAFRREAFERMTLPKRGMEFAPALVVQAALRGMRIKEVPTILYKDGRGRPPHLRTWRDGWRQLRYLVSCAVKRTP